MPGSPGSPIVTEPWHFLLLMAAGIAAVWFLTRLARKRAEQKREKDKSGDPNNGSQGS